jgi:hypothetical protein
VTSKKTFARLKVDELAPNFGWNPADGKRKSGGGRHMPNAAKKPHRGQGGRPQQQRNEGRYAKGDGPAAAATADGSASAGARPQQSQSPRQARPPKRDWNPVALNGGQVDRPADGSKRFARADGDRKPHGDRKPTGDRNFAGGKPNRPGQAKRPPSGGKGGGFAKPNRPQSSGGSWMKQIVGES